MCNVGFSRNVIFGICLAQPKKTLDPDQLASDEVILSGSTVFHSECAVN